MALYNYSALTRAGKSVTGSLDAPNTQAVRDYLSQNSLFPVKIDLASTAPQASWFSRLFQKSVSLKDKIFFTRQLSVLLKSGVPLTEALDLLAEQTEGKLRDIVISLRDTLKEGNSLASGLQKYPKVFDVIYIQLIKAGEATGKLETILERLIDYLERRDQLKRKISGALRYPMIQLGMTVLITAFLLYKVIPEIIGAFASQNIKLPWSTRFLVSLSHFITTKYLYILGAIILLVIIYRFWKATPSGAYTLDKIKLKLPIIGYFARNQAIVQFSRTLGTLIEGGVNLAESLSIVVKIVDNKVLSQELEKAKEKIIKQGKIAQYLKETGLFPPVAIYLIKTGEESGQLDQMLLTVAKYYEDELTESADSLTTLLNPIMLLIMGVVVGFIIFSIMSPIMSLMNLTQSNV